MMTRAGWFKQCATKECKNEREAPTDFCRSCLNEHFKREDEMFAALDEADALDDRERQRSNLTPEEIDAELEQSREYFDRYIAGDR